MHRTLRSISVLMLIVAHSAAFAGVDRPPIKIAVFDFELEDVTPAAAFDGKSTSSASNLQKVGVEAREMLAKSGRYSIIDASTVQATPVLMKSLRNCEGCEAAIALALGAEQSMMGVITRVTQTDYYVQVQIRNCRTGKVLDEQEANFAGGDDGWASGVRMLIKHQILVGADP